MLVAGGKYLGPSQQSLYPEAHNARLMNLMRRLKKTDYTENALYTYCTCFLVGATVGAIIGLFCLLLRTSVNHDQVRQFLTYNRSSCIICSLNLQIDQERYDSLESLRWEFPRIMLQCIYVQAQLDKTFLIPALSIYPCNALLYSLPPSRSHKENRNARSGFKAKIHLSRWLVQDAASSSVS